MLKYFHLSKHSDYNSCKLQPQLSYTEGLNENSVEIKCNVHV